MGHSVFSENITAKKCHSPTHIPGSKMIPTAQNKENFQNPLKGKPEIIQFILSDKYMDGPGQDLRHILRKSV